MSRHDKESTRLNGPNLPESKLKLSSLFTPDQVLCLVDELSCHEIIHRLIELLAKKIHPLDIEDVYQQIVKRESCGIAPMGPQAAAIHLRVKGIDRLHLALCSNRRGLQCTVAPGESACVNTEMASAKLVILMLAPFDDPAAYLRGMTSLTHLFHREGFLERVLSLTDPDLVWKTFDDANEHIPSYVKARDIMDKDFPRLGSSDALNTAIDTFCRLGVSELPVVDDDGDLVGVVTEDELIRVCLPEYITWMEDLSPILNFEPFAEILRSETMLSVMEIIVFAERYATVDEASPAVQVAKVMMRRNVRQVYVTRDKTLVGVVSIQDFIHKVLRA